MAQPTPVLSHLPDASRTELIMSVPNSLPQVTTASVNRKPPGRPVSAPTGEPSPAGTGQRVNTVTGGSGWEPSLATSSFKSPPRSNRLTQSMPPTKRSTGTPAQSPQPRRRVPRPYASFRPRHRTSPIAGQTNAQQRRGPSCVRKPVPGSS